MNKKFEAVRLNVNDFFNNTTNSISNNNTTNSISNINNNHNVDIDDEPPLIIRIPINDEIRNILTNDQQNAVDNSNRCYIWNKPDNEIKSYYSYKGQFICPSCFKYENDFETFKRNHSDRAGELSSSKKDYADFINKSNEYNGILNKKPNNF